MSSRFVFRQTPIAGLTLVERQRIGDDRGYLERLFCSQELTEVGWPGSIAQINKTYTARPGAVRGMHFQHPPHREAKLVMCMRGRVFDVAVDIRQGSPTFLQWHGEVLEPESHNALLIPEGFAHGFQALTEDVEMLYCHSAAYAPDSEGGLHAKDPRLGISWPREIAALSPRDESHPFLDGAFRGISV